MTRTGETTPVTNIRMAIENAIAGAVGEIHTCIPGIIVSYDADTQLATVQVAIKRIDADDQTYTVPPIQNVPVVFPRSAFGSMTWKLQTDDTVLLLFSERPLDKWRQNGGLVGPADLRRFHAYTDAIALAGLSPDDSPVSFDSDNDRDGITIQTAAGKVVIGSDGKIRIGKRGASPDEPAVLGTQLLAYLGAIHSALDAVLQAVITGPVGVGNLGNPVPTDPALAVALGLQKTALSTAKTTYIDTATTNVVSQRTYVDRGT